MNASWADKRTVTERRPVPRFLGIPVALWVVGVALLAVLTGGSYAVWFAHTAPPGPRLPAPPPHATVLGASSTADMLEGNFITTTGLFRSTDSPATLIAYYRKVLATEPPQVGRFNILAYSSAPTNTPATALQYMPPIFDTPTKQDAHAAKYVYTEYAKSSDDVAVAIDMRYPKGPTLVYMEMLTQPS